MLQHLNSVVSKILVKNKVTNKTILINYSPTLIYK